MSTPAPSPASELNRILVVDDESIVLVSLRETLRLQGYEVFAVEDPRRGAPTYPDHRFLSDFERSANADVDRLGIPRSSEGNPA